MEVDVCSVEKNIVNKVSSEVDSAMTTFGTGVQQAILTAMESLLNSRGDLAKKSFNASSGQDANSVVPETDR